MRAGEHGSSRQVLGCKDVHSKVVLTHIHTCARYLQELWSSRASCCRASGCCAWARRASRWASASAPDADAGAGAHTADADAGDADADDADADGDADAGDGAHTADAEAEAEAEADAGAGAHSAGADADAAGDDDDDDGATKAPDNCRLHCWC